MWHWVKNGLFLIGLAATGSSLAGEPDWSKVTGKEIPMFYPGPAGYEWVMNRTDHTGAQKLGDKKQNCFDCHEYDADVIGNDIVAGKKVGKARTVIDSAISPGMRGTFPLTVKAARDESRIYLRFEWESAAAPANASKSDPKNEIKLSLMFGNAQVDGVALSGCWMTCHMDLRTMPDAQDKAKKHPRARALGWNNGVTKYLPVSRTSLSEDKKPRGGWDKLQRGSELNKALKAGNFLDLLQYRSGEGEKAIDGYVLESRHMAGGKSLLGATGKRDGNKWIVTFERLLAADGTGDHAIVPGQPLTFGFAIHENHSNARFHHVSLGYTLGLDDPASFLNAAQQPGANGQTPPASAPTTPSAAPTSTPNAAPASENVRKN